MNELKERYSKKKQSNIEDYCIGKLVNKGNLPKNKAVKEKEKKKKKEIPKDECVAVEKEKCKREEGNT